MKNRIQTSVRLSAAALCLVFCLLANHVGATVIYWDNNGTAAATSGTWNTTSSQWATSTTLTASAIVWNTNDAACFCAGSQTGTVNITVTNAISCAGIYNGPLTPPGCTLNFIGAGSLNIISNSVNNGYASVATGGSDSAPTTITIPITGPAVLTVEYSDTLNLYSASTYSGGTLLGYPGIGWGGVLNFTNSAAFGTGPISVYSSGGALQLNESAYAVNITNAMIFTNGTPNLNILGNTHGLTFSGPWTIGPGNVPNIGSGNAVGNIVIISGVISGAGNFSKDHTGILELTATNTYTGVTTVTNGILQLGDGVANNGTVASSSGITVTSPGALVFATPPGVQATCYNTISGSGSVTNAGPGEMAIWSANGYTGGTTISGGKLDLNNNQAIGGTFTLAGGTIDNTSGGDINLAYGNNNPLVLKGSVAFAGTANLELGSGWANLAAATTLTVSNNTLTIGGVITNTSALTKAGVGTLNLAGANTYSGVTTVSAGTLQAGAYNALSPASPIIVASGATLDLNSQSQTIAALSGPGSVINLAAYNPLTLSGNAATNSSQNMNGYSCFFGTLAGGGNLVKDGTHAMAVRANLSSYSGAIGFNSASTAAGTLSVGGAPNLLPVSTALTVPSGALFQLDANNQTVATLNGSGNINLGGGILTIAQSGYDNFSGVIQNSSLAGSSTAAGNGLRGYYYTNIDLTGLGAVRDDATVNLPNMTALPGYLANGSKTNQISVRWLGQVLTTAAGTYTFSTTCDDGSRLWVNGTLLVNNWVNEGATLKSGTIALAANTRYDLVMEYYNNTAGGSSLLSWTPPGDLAGSMIPSANLFLPAAGSLALNGAGQQVLSGVNTYTGGTTINDGGTLEASSLGSGNVTVANGVLQLDATTAMNANASLILATAAPNQVNLNFTGTGTIYALSLNGGASYLAPGTYGPLNSNPGGVFSGSYGGALIVTAAPATTANVLTTSPVTTAVYGTTITLTATLPSSATGTVTFNDGPDYLGASPLVAGVASLIVSNLQVSASPHSLTAVYGGDATHAASTSSAVAMNITVATLTPSLVIGNKTYDGTTTATATSTNLAGLLPGDTNYVHLNYVANFSDANVGVGKNVTITLSLGGSLASDYTLATTSLSATANITNKVLTLYGLTTTNRAYNATTSENFSGTAVLNPAGIVAGDSPTLVTASPVIAFATKTVGNSKALSIVSGYSLTGTGAGNYILTLTNLANITAFPLGVSVTVNPKTYDGTTNVTLTGAALNPAPFAGDTVTLGGTVVAGFTNANVGLRGVTISGYTISGADAANYTLSQPTGLSANITQASTSTAITPSVNPSTVTSNVTFTFTVTSTTPTSKPPTGTATFYTNSVPLVPTVTLVSNTPTSSTASYSTALLPLGTTVVAAQYGGDANFLAPLYPASTNQVVQTGTTCSATNVILSLVNNGGNSFTLTLQGTYKAEYYVAATTNVEPPINWQPVPGSTNTVTNANGQWSITVTNPAPAFYRAYSLSGSCP